MAPGGGGELKMMETNPGGGEEAALARSHGGAGTLTLRALGVDMPLMRVDWQLLLLDRAV